MRNCLGISYSRFSFFVEIINNSLPPIVVGRNSYILFVLSNSGIDLKNLLTHFWIDPSSFNLAAVF